MKVIKALNFGCGNDFEKDNNAISWEHWDFQKGDKIDKSFDFNKFPYPAKDNSFDFIKARQILQCLDYPKKVLDELNRILKIGGKLHIITNYWNSKGAYSYILTRHYFSDTTFKKLVNDPDEIDQENKWELISIKRNKSWFVSWLPERILHYCDYFISGLFQDMEIILIKK